MAQISGRPDQKMTSSICKRRSRFPTESASPPLNNVTVILTEIVERVAQLYRYARIQQQQQNGPRVPNNYIQ